MATKKQSQSQKLGAIGQTQVRLIFEKAGWIVTGLDGPSDFGEDQLVRVTFDGVASELLFFVQVKATAGDFEKNKLKIKLRTVDLDIWLGITSPVFLVVWSEKTQKAYWLDAQEYARKLQDKNANWSDATTHMAQLEASQNLDDHGLNQIQKKVRSIYYKHALQTREAITVKFLFSFPKNEDGTRAKEELESHFRTGSPVEVSGKYIKNIKFPKWHQRIRPTPPMTEDGVLKIKPATNGAVLECCLGFTKHGETLEIDDIQLRTVQAGIEEITATNYHQENRRADVKVKLRTKDQNAQLDFGLCRSQRVKDLVYRQRIIKMLSEGCEVSLYVKKTGSKFLSLYNQEKDSTYDPQILDFFIKLRRIEEHFNVEFLFPEAGVSDQEVETVERLHKLITDGLLELTMTKSARLQMQVSRENAEMLLTEDETPLGLNHETSHNFNLMGNELTLSNIRETYLGVLLKGEKEAILQSLAKDTGDLVTLNIDIPKGSVVKIVNCEIVTE